MDGESGRERKYATGRGVAGHGAQALTADRGGGAAAAASSRPRVRKGIGGGSRAGARSTNCANADCGGRPGARPGGEWVQWE